MFDIISILSWAKKNLRRKDVVLIFLLVFLYLLTRLINLDQFPIFSDEGIYIRWAKVAWHDATWRFISLTDGKQPLQTWGTIPFLKLFPDNALLAGRLFSVATGFAALVGMFSLLFYLFGKRTALIGSFLYVVTPYFLFYDRMALVDSGVNAGFIWMLFFSILLIRTQRLDMALLFGFITGFSLLAKSSVRLFLGLSFLAPILTYEKNIKKNIPKVLNFLVLFSIAAVLALVIYNVQRLSPFFHYVAEKNKTFVMTFSEFRAAPFSNFFNNIKIIPAYVLGEMGWLPGLFALLGFSLLFKKERNLAWYLLLWMVIPFFIVAFLSKVIFPRYLIFFGTLILILTAYFLAHQTKKLFLYSLIPMILIFAFYGYAMLFDFVSLPFPEVDRGQYVEGKTAGWGASEIVEFAREKSKEKPVILIAEGNFGLVGDVLDVFTRPDDKIFIRGYWPLNEKELLENRKELDKNNVYVVFSHQMEIPSGYPVRLIKRYEKPGGKAALILGELIR